MSQVHVTISGPVGSGKSRIGRLIQLAFRHTHASVEWENAAQAAEAYEAGIVPLPENIGVTLHEVTTPTAPVIAEDMVLIPKYLLDEMHYQLVQYRLERQRNLEIAADLPTPSMDAPPTGETWR